MYLQLIINPGSTSTKLALYRDEEKLVQEDVTHDSNELAKYKDIVDQVPMRMAFIQDFRGESLRTWFPHLISETVRILNFPE